MAEKILWIAKCKLRGMNQRIGVVYDERTLAIRAIRMVGPGRGKLAVMADLPQGRVRQVRLAHKSDIDILDLTTAGLALRQLENGEITLPFQLDVGWDCR